MILSESHAIECTKHGKHAENMRLIVKGEPIGTYCFYCYNDFLNKYLKNYKKEDE